MNCSIRSGAISMAMIDQKCNPQYLPPFLQLGYAKQYKSLKTADGPHIID